MFIEPSKNAKLKGWIEVICGSMFSGKTEELIRRLKRAQLANQKVEIYNVTNGNRFATYVMPAPTGEIAINGAAAWKAGKGDIIIIAHYVHLNEEEAGHHKPTLVYVNPRNEVVSVRNEPPL